MPFREIIAIIRESYGTHKLLSVGQMQSSFNVKTAGAYSIHCTLKRLAAGSRELLQGLAVL
jgi:hypothetical protein